MINDRDIDFDHSTTFEASYVSMSVSYQIMGPLRPDNALQVVYLGMRDKQGRFVEVPCTYVAAELIRLYDTGTLLTLYISPTVINDDVFDEFQLIPLAQ